jgi:DNA-binding NtrC family response regulator
MNEKPKILIVDDEEDTRDIFSRHLETDYDVMTAASGAEALELLDTHRFHVALTDLVMPGMSGTELLSEIKTSHPQVAVVLVSGKATISTAVKAIKQGAEDFIEKPVEDLDIINFIIEKVMKMHWQAAEIARLRSQLDSGFNRDKIVGNSLSIQKIMEKVRLIAPLDTTVVISGETGVGKEMFAELIFVNSNRKNKKFVAVNCGSLSETLLESTLFGHKKGSFTDAVRDKAGYFQEADGGTLFLDELTETSPAFQIKLLRVLEKGMIRRVGGESDIPVDVRIITASNKDMAEEVKKGNFREDLYYRLNVMNINIPPLRERTEDIPILAHHFVQEFAQKHKKPVQGISEPALAILNVSEWKGNVRELKNAMEHSVILATHNLIMPQDLPASVHDSQKYTPSEIDTKILRLPYQQAKDTFERNYVLAVLKRCKGDVTQAAELTGIKRQNLYEKFSKFNIDPNAFRN